MHYDAIIIGTGQAAAPLAFRLVEEKQKVAVIEKSHVGGTCINTGCTPTKTYVASARRIWAAQNGAQLGIQISGDIKADFKKIKERKEKIVQGSREGIMKGFEDSDNIHFFKGTGKFISDKKIRIGNEEISGDKIFLNTGARPRILEEFKHINYLTNESLLELEEIPEHLIIIGGSYIGLEFGQMFKRFGSKVTIIEKSDRLIGREDISVSREIYNIFLEDGINLNLNSTVKKVNKQKDGINIRFENEDGEKNITGSHLLIAAGRIPNTDILDIKNTGIKLDDKGYIKTNDFLETDVEGIYALGDCNGKGAFTHTSYNDYEIVADRLFGEKKRKVSDRIVTYCLYIDPPLGRAGLTLKQAKNKGFDILHGHLPMSKVSRANEKGETRGFMEIIIDKKTEKILGAAILGSGGDEIIASILNAMYSGASYKDIKDSVIPHPTVTELIPTMLQSLKDK